MKPQVWLHIEFYSFAEWESFRACSSKTPRCWPFINPATSWPWQPILRRPLAGAPDQSGCRAIAVRVPVQVWDSHQRLLHLAAELQTSALIPPHCSTGLRSKGACPLGATAHPGVCSLELRCGQRNTLLKESRRANVWQVENTPSYFSVATGGNAVPNDGVCFTQSAWPATRTCLSVVLVAIWEGYSTSEHPLVPLPTNS